MEMGVKSELALRSGGKGDWSLAAIVGVGKKTVFTCSPGECIQEIEEPR